MWLSTSLDLVINYINAVYWKKSEKFKAKAIHYAGRRHCDRSGRHMKPQSLFGQVHVKDHRKPVESKSNDFGAGWIKADGVRGGCPVSSLPGVALRGCAGSHTSPLNVPTLEPPGSTHLREPFPAPSPRRVWMVSRSVCQGWIFCPFVQKPHKLQTYLWWHRDISRLITVHDINDNTWPCFNCCVQF